MYYFLADLKKSDEIRNPPVRCNSTEQFREALADLERVKPRYVLWDSVIDGDNWKRWYPSYIRPPEADLIIEPYLLRHYGTIATKSGFRIMERFELTNAVE